MSEQNNIGRELGWDDEISNDSGAFILLEGDHIFTVTGFERGRFPGSAKIPACNKATLTLEVETAEGRTSMRYDLILYSTLEWKISAFLRAIGQKKHGEPTRPRWNEMVGARGRAKFKPRPYTGKDGTEKQANDIVDFYDYDPVVMGGAQHNGVPAERSSVGKGATQERGEALAGRPKRSLATGEATPPWGSGQW